MISAYQSGIPGNGTPFPDGAKMAQIHWNPTTLETLPTATVPASLHDVDFNGEGQQGTLKNGRVEQSNFHNYRVSRMNETPSIEVHLGRNDEALGGIGEPGTASPRPRSQARSMPSRGSASARYRFSPDSRPPA